MGQTKTTIELNGKLYDATTGKVVSSADARTVKPVAKPQAVDGFIRQTGHHPKPNPTKPTARQPAVRHPNPAQHKPQRSNTLMRHVVQKPTSSNPVKASSPKPTPATSVSSPSNRDTRAANVTKSTSISRFGHSQTTRLTTKVAPLAVKPHPEQHHSSQAAKPASAATKTFDNALRSASSHTKGKLKKSRVHHRAAKKLGISSNLVIASTLTMSFVLLAGFVAYQNVPNLSMRIAANRAGFSASLPQYTPSGFGVAGPIKAAPGAITVSFRSHSDDRSFEVTQKPSNWTSDSLLSSFVATNKQSYQTYQEKGKTIYIYNGSNATWVNGGVWYQVNGSNANLNSEQLVRIADSL